MKRDDAMATRWHDERDDAIKRDDTMNAMARWQRDGTMSAMARWQRDGTMERDGAMETR
jgi:hypothetical protein